jgi:HD-GYP domain-containing protein (c-di-GMP phosphodiesterase class II)
MMDTAGFADSLEERIFFTGSSNDRDPTRVARAEARKAAAMLLHTVIATGPEGEDHCERVAVWARRLAREMGLSPARQLDVELGALVHDVGYAGLRAVSYLQQGALTAADWVELHRHCEHGAALLREIPLLRRAIPLVLSHHEHFDGTGYPRRLAGLQIPLEARIFHLVDAYESLTSDRPHRVQCSDATARLEIARCVGTHFDPVVHAAFTKISPVEWRALGAVAGSAAPQVTSAE